MIPVKDDKTRREVIDLLVKSNLPVEDLDENKNLYAMIEDEHIVGTGGLEFFGDCALVRSVSIKEEERGRGLGKSINRYLEKIAKENGVHYLYLLTTTAREFFTKEGYETIGREIVPDTIKTTSEFSSVCPSTAVVMKKKIK
jgi:amino-acid N-acetyltransferase